MRQYNYIQALVLAFFSKPLYRDVKQHWRGWGVLYVLFLSVLFCWPTVYLLHNFITPNTSGTLQIYDLLVVPNGYDLQQMRSFIPFFNSALWGATCGVAIFLLFLRGIIAILFLAALAKAVTHTKLSYRVLCRLAAIAITPAVILSALLSVLSIHIPYVYVLYFLLSMFYVLFGIDANKS